VGQDLEAEVGVLSIHRRLWGFFGLAFGLEFGLFFTTYLHKHDGCVTIGIKQAAGLFAMQNPLGRVWIAPNRLDLLVN
jgi:hypothetical protein